VAAEGARLTAGKQKPQGGFNWVHKTFYDDLAVRGWSDDLRATALYLLTCPDRASEGFFRLRLINLCGHLRRDEDTVREALGELERAGFARYDERAEVVLILKALKYQAPAGRTQIRGAVAAVERVHDAPELFNALLEAADRYASEFADALREHYGIEGVSRGYLASRENSRTSPTPTPSPTRP